MKTLFQKFFSDAGIWWRIGTLLFLAGFYFAIMQITQKSVEAVCEKQTQTDSCVQDINTRVTIVETKIIGMKETIDDTNKDVKELLRRM